MKKNTAYTIGSLIVLLICAFCFVILPAFTGSEGQQNKLPPFGKEKLLTNKILISIIMLCIMVRCYRLMDNR